MLGGQRRVSREPPVRLPVEDFGLPHDFRHPREGLLRLLCQPLFTEFAVEPPVKFDEMGGIEGGVVELLFA